jgi:thiosulfate dehydrogenase
MSAKVRVLLRWTLVVATALAFLLPNHGIVHSQPIRQKVKPIVPLIRASETMYVAWEIPMNPLTDSLLAKDPLADQVRRGFRIFTNTPNESSRFSSNKLSCSNCHLNAGQRERALPLVGVAGAFPEYNKRAGRLFSLEDRIVGCFLRSQNASTGRGASHENDTTEIVPSTRSEEVLALSAYITWLSRGLPVGVNVPWRGHNTIPAHKLISVNKLDPKRGEDLFMEKCITCHGEDGQGVEIGDKKAGPLWGPESWNDGAGAARIYTLAGMIRYTMPYLDPGSLTDEEAQHISAFINSKERPNFPNKRKDYLTEPLPSDAVYYLREMSCFDEFSQPSHP